MNKKIAELCDSYANVHLVDIHSEFLGHGIHCTEWWRKHYKKDDPHYWYARNFEDPNPRGHDAIRRLFLLKMAEVHADLEGAGSSYKNVTTYSDTDLREYSTSIE